MIKRQFLPRYVRVLGDCFHNPTHFLRINIMAYPAKSSHTQTHAHGHTHTHTHTLVWRASITFCTLWLHSVKTSVLRLHGIHFVFLRHSLRNVSDKGIALKHFGERTCQMGVQTCLRVFNLIKERYRAGSILLAAWLHSLITQGRILMDDIFSNGAFGTLSKKNEIV